MYRNIAIITIILAIFCLYVIALDCYKCRSDIDKKCAVSPGKDLEVIECPKDDKCVVGIFDKITHRTCLSKLRRDCNGPLCYTCNTNLCNGEIFPKDRWTCYQCSGSACLNVTKSKFTPLPCPLYVENDRCFTDIISIHHIIRGCVSGEEKLCPNICLKCDTKGCNNEQGVFESKCQSCSWMPGESMYPKDFDCKRMQKYNSTTGTNQCLVERDNENKTCIQKVLLGHKEKCYTHWNPHVNVVVRGCSTTMGHYPSGKLWECYGDNCNSDCITMKCNQCDSDTNPNCRNNTRYLHEKDCPDDNYACYSCEDKNRKLTRGCGFQATTTDKQCYNCYDDEGCNKENVRTCFKCTSTQDPNCARWIDLRNIDREKCDNPYEKCVITKTSQYTVRGCENKVKECTEGDPNCRRCEGSLCNVGEYN
ncbi:uncharacterized protein LOC129618464 [Condylostylus longicornis]|uniref:uncharacterized protein LOC129618464 n=1 Tax=Condylostylus longicornis TaxID=2530218 RepID=UPI00244E2EAB|nr:uncharacterized protein LOC129618464 [Condylostylus longicornis]